MNERSTLKPHAREPGLPVLVGSGELRLRSGSGEAASYAGTLQLGDRTIELEAKVVSNGRGRCFSITATLDPNIYRQTQLDRMLTYEAGGQGCGALGRSRCGSLVDDAIPFGAA